MCPGSDTLQVRAPGMQYKPLIRCAHQRGSHMEANVAVLTVDLASGPSEISGLGSCRRAHILFMYGDQPICRREVDVIDGTITRTELVMAMKELDADPRAHQRGLGYMDRSPSEAIILAASLNARSKLFLHARF